MLRLLSEKFCMMGVSKMSAYDILKFLVGMIRSSKKPEQKSGVNHDCQRTIVVPPSVQAHRQTDISDLSEKYLKEEDSVSTDQEEWIATKLRKKYGVNRVFQNVLIPRAGVTTEIDVLLLTEKGIVVIEAKDYSGIIYGDEDSQSWAEYISGHKYNFPNPVMQNTGHVRALAEYLGVDPSEVWSLIVFSSVCEFQRVPGNHGNMILCQEHEFMSILRGLFLTSGKLYHDELLDDWAKLLKSCEATEETMKQHVQDVKTRCPWCGGKLVQRSGPNGYFMGCSNYPNCRYTRRIQV